MRHFLRLALAVLSLALSVVASTGPAALVARTRLEQLPAPSLRPAVLAAIGVAAVAAATEQKVRPALPTGAPS